MKLKNIYQVPAVKGYSRCVYSVWFPVFLKFIR